MTDERTQIQAFLQINPPKKGFLASADDIIYHKAGIIPFRDIGGVRHYVVMKPVAKRLDLGEPEFQLCKGTRMYFEDGTWQDMKKPVLHEQMEPLVETALREGIEELGIILDNIDSIIDVGPYTFTSATTGKEKTSWMFAASIKDTEAFLPLADIAGTTSERNTVTLLDFKKLRPDHMHILQQVDTALGAIL